MSILDQNISAEGTVTPSMRGAYATMSPWLRFIGICGMIGSVIYFIGILALLATGARAFAALGAFGSAPTALLLFILLFAGLMFYLSLLLYQSGGRMKAFVQYNDVIALEQAVLKQKTYWLILGVLLAIYLVIIVLAIVYSIAMA
ncbi:hypothetical protein BH09BAC1_BH09BAC1_30520 [soil metagenome]